MVLSDVTGYLFQFFTLFSALYLQDEEDFGHLDDDLDSFMNSNDTSAASWNLFNGPSASGYAPVGNGSGRQSPGNASNATGLGNCASCCKSCMRMWRIYFTNACCGVCCGGNNSNTPGGEGSTGQQSVSGSTNTSARSVSTVGHKKNLNMVSAFTHILGDTLRTLSMLVAAVVASVTGIDGDICDAWAALVVSLTIIVLCVSLVIDVTAAACTLYKEEYGEGTASGGGRAGAGARRRRAGAGRGSYSRVNDIDCDDLPDVEV
jgi:Co/Zn/Cd efflux system component